MTTPFQPASSPYFGATRPTPSSRRHDPAIHVDDSRVGPYYSRRLRGLSGGIGFFGFLIAFVLWIGILFVMRWASERAPVPILLGLYFTFTAVGGVMLSGVAAYRVETLLFALALTGGVFVAMSVIGLTTKKDLTNWGPHTRVSPVGPGRHDDSQHLHRVELHRLGGHSTALAGISGLDDLRDQTG